MARTVRALPGINERECLLRVVTIGPCEMNRQRDSLSVANQTTLAAQLGPVGDNEDMKLVGGQAE